MKENLRRLAGSGCLAAGHQAEGLDLIAHYLAGEEAAKACPATFLSARASAFLCAGALKLFGTAAQKERYIPALLRADRVGALAYSEEGAGSDLAAAATAARHDGEAWLISGTKDIVVNGPIADVFIVLAGHENEASLFIVENTADGCAAAEPVETLGMRGAPIAAVSFNGCKAAGVLGGVPGRGREQLSHLLTLGGVGIAALCVGIGTACMERSVSRAKTRAAFGKPIGLYQDVGFKLADMFTLNDLGRMLALRAAWALNTKEPGADELAAGAKLFATEAATKIAGWAMQIFAGHGYLAGSDVERLYRDAKFGEICEGTSELQRTFIAQKELDRFQ
jgi:alkylation response protein AidB-like acyl-CoA dehydrogenase